jgi:hypothetical protein
LETKEKFAGQAVAAVDGELGGETAEFGFYLQPLSQINAEGIHFGKVGVSLPVLLLPKTAGIVIAVAPIGEKTAELLPVQIVEVGGGFGGQATDLVTNY